jgi:hypothetical protein
MNIKLKPKTCKACKHKFTPRMPLQYVCNPLCARRYAEVLKAKRERLARQQEKREAKAALEKIKTKSQWLKETQAIFNKWVRLRDAGLPCIACDKPMLKKINGSHFKSVGAHPELRFEPLNCHAGCEHCNTYKSGNLINYRINLLNRIGVAGVDWLESKHEPKHYTIDDIIAIKKHYQAKVKELS